MANTTTLTVSTNLPRSDHLLDDDSNLSQFSPDNSPTLKSSFHPSEVLLFKGVPSDLREIEVIQLFEPYGLVKDILIAHHKRYLFVQFENEVQAIHCYQDFTAHISQIRNYDIYACYTGKSRISKPKALLNPTSRFIHLKFGHSYAEINTNTVTQLLPAYYTYKRIWLNKQKTWEAFVEMEDVFKAIFTKEYILQSQTFINNQIAVNFCSEKEVSQQGDCQEEYKDENCDDLTLPPSMIENSSYEELPNFSMTAFPCFSDPYLNSGSPMMSCSPTFSNGSPVLRPMNPGSPILNPRLIIQPNSMHNGCESPVLESMSPTMGGSPLLVPMSLNQFGDVNSYNQIANNVLHIKELPEYITPLMLFRLFGMYGNVLKVKILFNHPDKAFIEFQSTFQAELARRCLNNCSVMGKILKVDFAKKGTIVDISLLKKEPNNKYLGDFSNSSEHRYKYVGSKNHANISPPSKVLHLSNLHIDKDEKFYRELFRDSGKVKKFIFMKNEEKMALVEMSSVEDALNILIHFHNYDIDGKYLKVTFSKYRKVTTGK